MAKEFKRSNSKDFKDKKSSEPKTRKDSKKDHKPSFERYRDDSRPSDFGSSAPRKSSASGYGDNKRKPFGDKPAFRKKRDDDDSSERKPAFDREKKSGYGDEKRKPFGDKPAFRKTRSDDSSERKPASFDREKKSGYSDEKRKSFGDKPAFRKTRDDDSSERKPASFDREKKSSYTENKRRSSSDKPAFRKTRDDGDRPERGASKKNYDDDFYESKPAFVRASDRAVDYEQEYLDKKNGTKKAAPRPKDDDDTEKASRTDKSSSLNHSRPYKKRVYEKKSSGKGPSSGMHKSNDDGTIRLNKYIANAGICSRREADDLIESGVVQVNGKVITEMGYKVKPTDVIKYGGQTLKKERLVYLILNKPKDYVTTSDDPQQRKTVLELVQDACRERIYPVGRLDRATTGLLMFTNDGELTKKLTHPRYGVRKIYHVELDKPLKRSDFDLITEGLELEDGPIKVDEISYVADGKDKTNVGVEIHSGKNRIVRRIFEHLGYNVRKLDRVVFGPLTKKELSRGRWRFLTESEVGMLKMISSGE